MNFPCISEAEGIKIRGSVALGNPSKEAQFNLIFCHFSQKLGGAYAPLLL